MGSQSVLGSMWLLGAFTGLNIGKPCMSHSGKAGEAQQLDWRGGQTAGPPPPFEPNNDVWHWKTGRAGEIQYITHNRERLTIWLYDGEEEWRRSDAFWHAPPTIHNWMHEGRQFAPLRNL